MAYVVSTPVKRPPNEMDILMSIYLDIPLFLGNAEDGTVWAVEESGFWDVTEMLQ